MSWHYSASSGRRRAGGPGERARVRRWAGSGTDTITARPHGRSRTAWPIRPGVPGRCPACEGLGYIDSIDIAHRYQIQHCTVCLHRWEYLFDAEGAVVGLTELDATGQPVTRSRVRPVPGGIEDEPADAVVDLRDPAPDAEPVPDLTATEQLTPAEWIRQSARG